MIKLTVSEAKKKFNRDIPPGKYEASGYCLGGVYDPKIGDFNRNKLFDMPTYQFEVVPDEPNRNFIGDGI